MPKTTDPVPPRRLDVPLPGITTTRPFTKPDDVAAAEVGSPEQPLPPKPPYYQEPGRFSGGVYPQTLVDTEYKRVTGEIAVPVAGPDGTLMQVSKLHAGYYLKVVRFAIEALDQQPVMPSPDTSNPNERLIDEKILLCAPGELPNGHKVYRTTGTYLYALRAPLGVRDAFQVVTTPVDQGKPADYAYAPKQFDKSLSASSPPVATVTQPGATKPLTPLPALGF